MTPLKTLWFNGGKGAIGIVKARSDHGEIGYFIGCADGLHEVIDINNIANLGAKFPIEAAEVLFGKHIEEKQNVKNEEQLRVRSVEERPTRARGVQPLEGRARVKTDTKRKSAS